MINKYVVISLNKEPNTIKVSGVIIETEKGINERYPKPSLIYQPSDLPADFSVETYTIKDGELVRLSAEVIADREAAALRAAEQAATAVEIAEHKEYLTATDWAVVKCMEIGTPLAKAYPELATRRIEARARINELQRGGGYART